LKGKSDGDEESDGDNVMRLVWRGAIHVNGNASLTSKFNLGPMPLWHGAVFPFYMPSPPPGAKYVEEDSDCSVCSISGGRSSVVSVS
jgi:hypothetical protein